MSSIINKIKDAVSSHHEHAPHDDHKKKATDKKAKRLSRNDVDLNGAPSATREPLDLTGRHVDPDDRDIDGRRRSHSHDAPDLVGPHREAGERASVDINGRHPATYDAPDLTSGSASAGHR
ncbi:hypothetical protein F5Y17DRAFT_281957 [Xylariaceae sp. FL0594]|nr:hypothetical protein F5Y17DRAFT_281957 [Xylariaceae sp. FL0594]